MRYVIREQIPCYVDFYREVEADSEEEALEKDHQGDNDFIGFWPGGKIGFLDSTAYGVVDKVPDGICKSA